MHSTLSHNTLSTWLRLSLQPGVGTVHANRLLQHFKHPDALYSAPHTTLRALVSTTIATQLLQPPSTEHLREIDQALRWASEPAQRLITQADPASPALLLEMPDAPLVLYARGSVSRFKQNALALVGARNATADGLDHACAFARHLAQQGFTIVSGLAHGIDAAAHRGALKAGIEGGGTIAVLGTGVDLIYPHAHRSLADDILSNAGLLISELGLGRPALAAHFPKRNRIVAGLSLGVVVIEAALKSGSLITARLAVEMGREVFALPGSIHSPLSRGPHCLIKQGAKLVESSHDILTELRPDVQPLAPLKKNPPAPPESPVWDAIGYDPVSDDQLQRRTGLPPAQLQAELFTLELKGYIERRGPGRLVRAQPQ